MHEIDNDPIMVGALSRRTESPTELNKHDTAQNTEARMLSTKPYRVSPESEQMLNTRNEKPLGSFHAATDALPSEIRERLLSTRSAWMRSVTTKSYDPSSESEQMLNARRAQNEKYPDTQRILSSKWDSVAAAIESCQSNDEPSL